MTAKDSKNASWKQLFYWPGTGLEAELPVAPFVKILYADRKGNAVFGRSDPHTVIFAGADKEQRRLWPLEQK